MSYEVVGEGTYGCVTKPNLPCKHGKNTRKRKNRLTKIMTKEHALDEYNEMLAITRARGIKKYIISMPDICEPKLDADFFKTVQQCDNDDFPKLRPNDFALLVLEDGGISLKTFSDKFLPTLSTRDVEIFFTKIKTLLDGLVYFQKHNIIHHDIKTQNVVYNIQTGNLRYIDFGLMKMKTEMIRESKENDNGMAQKWANFPPEYDCANKRDYHVCDYKMNYDDFLTRLVNTFDSYSFGIMMLKIVKTARKYRKIPAMAGQILSMYFSRMGDPDIHQRDYELEHMVKQYPHLCKKVGIWRQETPNPTAKSVKMQSKLEKTVNMTPSEKQNLYTALKKRHDCRLGYERYQNDRCLKICKPGYERNPQTRRCRKKRGKDMDKD